MSSLQVYAVCFAALMAGMAFGYLVGRLDAREEAKKRYGPEIVRLNNAIKYCRVRLHDCYRDAVDKIARGELHD